MGIEAASRERRRGVGSSRRRRVASMLLRLSINIFGSIFAAASISSMPRTGGIISFNLVPANLRTDTK